MLPSHLAIFRKECFMKRFYQISFFFVQTYELILLFIYKREPVASVFDLMFTSTEHCSSRSLYAVTRVQDGRTEIQYQSLFFLSLCVKDVFFPAVTHTGTMSHRRQKHTEHPPINRLYLHHHVAHRPCVLPVLCVKFVSGSFWVWQPLEAILCKYKKRLLTKKKTA